MMCINVSFIFICLMNTNIHAHHIHIIQHFMKLNNYYRLSAVVEALNMPCITRLYQAWKGVPQRMVTRLRELQDLFDPSSDFRSYRLHIAEISPPMILYPAACLSDFALADLKADFANYETDGGIVNWKKMKHFYEVTFDIH